MEQRPKGCILFDWGDTLMRDNKNFSSPMKNWPVVEAIPGAVEILPALQTRWILGIATSADISDEKDIRVAFKRVKLDRWLDKIYCVITTGHNKPSLGFYRYILYDLRLPPSPSLWFEIITTRMC
jgi:putative hydrolase of the HAD superfamily